MRKIIGAFAIAVAAAAAIPAAAQTPETNYNYEPGNYVAPAVGVVGGTLVGVGLYNGWFGSGATATALGATAGTAAAAGGVAGVGLIAVTDAALQPCRGFSAMFNLRPTECVNGVWVGDRAPLRVHRRAMR